jgi:repressor LexA
MKRAPGSYAGLTWKQAQLLSFLRDCDDTPSFEEMKEHLGLASKSGVARLIAALEQRGYIRRTYGLARSIRVLDEPQPVQPREPDREFFLHEVPLAALLSELSRRVKVVA